jgi:hypothetical protein
MTSRWVSRSASGIAVLPWTRRRARLASWRAASGTLALIAVPLIPLLIPLAGGLIAAPFLLLPVVDLPGGRPREGRNKMGNIVMTEFVSLDGVIEDPGGVEGFKLGAWVFVINRGEDGDKFKLAETLDAEARLLGRKTYAIRGSGWVGARSPAAAWAGSEGLQSSVWSR